MAVLRMIDAHAVVVGVDLADNLEPIVELVTIDVSYRMRTSGGGTFRRSSMFKFYAEIGEYRSGDEVTLSVVHAQQPPE